jgi:hypothetical protein
MATHKAALDQPSDETHGAMVLDQQNISEFADAHRLMTGMRLDRQKRLMLLGGDPVFASAFLAERQELADLTPEFAQGLKIGRIELRRLRRRPGRGCRTFRCDRRFQAFIQGFRSITSSLREDSPKTGGLAIVSYRRTMKSRGAGDVPGPLAWERARPRRAPRTNAPISDNLP